MDGLLYLSHAAMDQAYERGEALPLAHVVTWLTRYRDAWWVLWEGGWLKVTDDLTAADIDEIAARIAQEEKEGQT